MENKINVAELIKDCPKGMELDCTMYENLFFVEVDSEAQDFPIKTILKNGTFRWFTSDGRYELTNEAKCVIFPKGKTTWEGFVPPCKFKDGDILYAIDEGNEYIFILKHIFEHGRVDCYLSLKGDDLRLQDVWVTDYNETHRLASDKEKEKLFKAIKDNGYKWNTETKIIERLSPKKFDISTLIPFESRVLVRDGGNNKWYPAVWGFYDNETSLIYPYGVVGGAVFSFCIPYEGNESLLGTKEDCDEFFKTWK